MKFRELLTESYFEGLYHISPNDNLTIENLGPLFIRDVAYGSNKPVGGLWLAKGLSWYRFADENEIKGPIKEHYLYRVKLKNSAKLAKLEKYGLIGVKTKKEKFMKDSGNPILPKSVDYKKLEKEYDGAQAYHNMQSTTFDVPSVVIWNKKVIESIEPLGKVKDAIEKKTGIERNEV